jgi:hypothetical protein
MHDMPYYWSFLIFEIILGIFHFVMALIGGMCFAFLAVPDADECDGTNGYVPKLICGQWSIPIFMLEWAVFIFCTHMLSVTFAMAMSTFFVSTHGSKVVFILWAINLLPAIGTLVDALDWGAGWRFLPGQYIVEEKFEILKENSGPYRSIRRFILKLQNHQMTNLSSNLLKFLLDITLR